MLISSVSGMIDYGKTISKQHKKIAVYGDLGAGKTHFTKGFAMGIGIDAINVQSPTYTIMNIYEDKLLHVDMYRINDENQLIEMGVLDYINQFEFVVIEWPKFENLYIDKTWLKIKINKIDSSKRQIQLL